MPWSIGRLYIVLFHNSVAGGEGSGKVAKLYKRALASLTETFAPVPIDALLLHDQHPAVLAELETEVVLLPACNLCSSLSLFQVQIWGPFDERKRFAPSRFSCRAKPSFSKPGFFVSLGFP